MYVKWKNVLVRVETVILWTDFNNALYFKKRFVGEYPS